MNLLDIVSYMQGKGHGTPGQTLFAYSMPESIDKGILVTSQVPIRRNRYVSDLRRGEFQVIARGNQHEDLIATLNSVSDTLNVQGITMGEMYFRYILPITDPLVFPRAESRLLEASVNFEFAYTQSI
jgi:hypothetical protein